MLIAITGPSSSGKSTLLEKCKEEYSGKFTFCEEITRKIKNKGLPINEQGNDITQLLILNSHIENSLYPNAILDRCILDGWVYTKYLHDISGTVSFKTCEYAEYVYSLLINKYDCIFYTEPVELIDDGVRSISKSFRDYTITAFESRIDIDPILRQKVVRLTGSVDERMGTIRRIITA